MLKTFSSAFTAHVIEEAREAKNGVEFLTTTRDDWKDSVFGCHITWHLTLYYFGEPVCPVGVLVLSKSCQKFPCIRRTCMEVIYVC